uniref:hypothetical protein n=1 Tax=Alistipes sp. TaxID=1872444 RepID=UPI0040571E71
MKNYFSYLKRMSVLAMLAIGSCMVACSDEETETPPGPGPEPVPEVPTVVIAIGEATETSISFTLTPTDAASVYYTVLEAEATLPTAEELFDAQTWGSRPADATQQVSYTWEGLTDNTAYKVVAAARNGELYSEVATADMRTLEKPFVQEDAKVGDFYYSDGTWSTELDPNKTPIAIVFYAGIASEWGDHISYYKDMEGNPMEKINGYAVALWDATWFEGEDYPQSWTAWENEVYCGTAIMKTADDIDFLGYDNTQKITAKAEELFGKLTPEEGNYPACFYATKNYESICPAPARSSGWFLPSAYQFKYLYNYSYFDDGNVRGCYEMAMNKLIEARGEEAIQPIWREGAMYWSSTEQIDAYSNSYRAIYMTFASDYIYTGSLSWSNKNAKFSIRSMIAF